MSKSDIDPFKPGSPLEQALHSLSGRHGGQSWSRAGHPPGRRSDRGRDGAATPTVGPSEGPEAVRGRFWTFSGESGPDHENRGRRIAQDRRRGPPRGVRGPPDSCPARANTVATSSTGCAMASSTGAPSRRTTISTRRPFIDPPMARPLTYPLRRPSLRRGGWVCR